MMTLRENPMAIYNHQQPDYYFDLMDAIQLVPDPVLMAGMFPQDGKEYKDPWGTAYLYKPGAPGPHPHCLLYTSRRCKSRGPFTSRRRSGCCRKR